MAYVLTKTWSLERMRDYAVGVVASLTALERLAKLEVPGMEALAGDWLPGLVGAWRVEKAAVAQAMTARDADRDRERETSATVRIIDVQWDATVKQLSGVAFLLANKDAKAEPYAQLFATVKADDLCTFGPAKATSAGITLGAKLTTLGNPQLTVYAGPMEAQTQALAAAHEEDTVAEAKAATHEIERLKVLRRLERLGAETEAQILTKFPGRKDLVRGVLDPEPEKGHSAKKAEAPAEPA